MAELDEFVGRALPHVSFDAWREPTNYKFPARKQERKPLRDDYTAHAAGLIEQLGAALGEVPTPATDRRLAIAGLKRGLIVEVETMSPSENSRVKAVKIPNALEFPAQDIIVLRSERNDDRTESALLFIPDDARDFLTDRIASYGEANLGNRRRPDVERFESIETIQAAAARALFVGPVDFDAADRVWWELWVREPVGHVNAVAAVARGANFDVHPDRLIFPDTIVVFVHAPTAGLLTLAEQIPGALTEIRRATGTIELFLDRGEHIVGQHDFVTELVERVVAPTADAPVVCVLDTGVAAAHPLLAPGLVGAWAYDEVWGTDDHAEKGGHGTGMAGLVLYGDLEQAMNDPREVVLGHAVESMKLLPPGGFPATEPARYGVVTQGAVAKVEVERADAVRSFCIASSSPDFSPARPSSWSGAIDQICAGAMPGERRERTPAASHPKRLVLVATGNIQGGRREDIEDHKPLEDPAQSWNALSIGGYTAKEAAPNEEPPLRPMVGANERSPYSRGSEDLPDDLTPIKPEVLFEAGNMLVDDLGFCGWHPAVSLLAVGSDVEREPLIPFWATSAATGVAGNFVGQLKAALPGYWPETYRALIVQSADWPQPIRSRLIGRGAHWKAGPKAQKQRILRDVGYGVPNLERAILSAKNDVTLIAQAEIQPFALGADGRISVFNEMHFYDLPWPKAELERLENETVTMKVTLSYFIEPNLTGRAATRPDTYRSFGLRFDMKKRTESRAHFRHRVNAGQASDDVKADAETSYWLLGRRAVQAGSLHCDLWRGQAIDLAGHDAIAVYPVGGWWKSHVGQKRMADKGRYALAISISAAGHAVDLYSEISTLVKAKEIEILID